MLQLIPQPWNKCFCNTADDLLGVNLKKKGEEEADN